jgi:uncharacterized protein YjbI with pentapeptide repeats
MVIAVIGWWGSKVISEKQIESAQILAKQQREAANNLAFQEIQSANLRSNADRDIEKLNQIREIFQEIVNSKTPQKDQALIKLQVSSLEIYKDLALGFLISIRDHYKKSKPEISQHAKQSIINILKASQPDFSSIPFCGEKDNPLNLRTRCFKGYNLSGSQFEDVNLFRSQFTQCSLQNVTFERVDLYEADFTGANLSGASFLECNMGKTNFKKAKLDGVRFVDCKNLENAYFTYKALLKNVKSPFKRISPEIYLLLLKKHRAAIEKEYEKDSNEFKDLEKSYDIVLTQLEGEQVASKK